jgi:methyl-accepting chemotaxis protein
MLKNLQFLQQLKVWQKQALVVVVLSLPMAYLLYAQISQSQSSIARDQKELRAVAFNRTVRQLLEQATQIGAGNQEAVFQMDEKLRNLEKLDQENDSELKMAERLRTLAQNLQTLKQANASDPIYSVVNSGIRDLYVQSGDLSGLLQDPDLDVLYVLFNVQNELPKQQDFIAQTADIARRALEKHDLPVGDRARLLSLTEQLRASLNAAVANVEKGVASNTVGTVKPLQSRWQNVQAQTQSYLDLLNQQVLTPAQLTAGPGELVSRSRDTLSQSYQFWDSANAVLGTLLQTRLEGLTRSRNGFLLAGLLVALIAGGLVYFVSRVINQQLGSLTHLVGQIEKGNQDARATVYSEDELGTLAKTFNNMLENNRGLIQSREERDRIQNGIMKLLNEVSAVAEGDLTARAEVTEDATGAIADSFNMMIEALRGIIGKVQTVTVTVNQSVIDTQAQTTMLAQNAEAQAANIIETSQEVGQMAQTIQEISTTAESSRRVAEQSLLTARAGAAKVENTIKSMGDLRDQVQETSKRIKRLGENSQEIGEIVQLIGDIAYRTSVLALNASIQAARAGEAGRGFGVVAEEVERLSKRSTEAAKRIAELVKTAQFSTNEAIASMEENTRNVVESTVFVQQAGQSLAEIEDVNAKLAAMIGSITTLTERQTKESDVVARTMLTISQATQETADGIKSSAETVNRLAELADDLQVSVASFRVGKAATAAPAARQPQGRAHAARRA